ncbi:MAG: dipeptide ABC transporter ATP-binding protein [Dongiaceae bacterium]
MNAEPLLTVEHLTIATEGPEGVPIVDDVSLQLDAGATLGIAGESGCGKSTLLLAMMGITRTGLVHRAGACRFDGLSLFDATERELERIRGSRIALIPQNAGTALTPTIRVGDQIDEALELHTDLDSKQRRQRIVELLDAVHLPTPATLGRRYPHELSGGQLQRAAVAMALAAEPVLLLLDEPTTGLDVTTQLGILDLLIELRRRMGVAMVCVSHDLGVIARLSDRMMVMYAGQTVEEAPTTSLLRRPAHPYARSLIASIPRLSVGAIPAAIPGRPPAPGKAPPGCRFAPRCTKADAICIDRAPPLSEIEPGIHVACHFPDRAALIWPAAEARHDSEAATAEPLLEIDDLVVSYARHGLIERTMRRPTGAHAVDHVELSLRPGEILGLVGESGSGKSTILRAIAGLWPALDGEIRFAGKYDLDRPAAARERSVLRAIQLVFQNPDASLNPRQTVREILSQPLRLYFNLSRTAMAERMSSLLRDVRLDDSYLDRYPAQLSGGERQRIAIARAYAAEPDILLCDEITSALDVSVQASILHLLRDLSRSRGTACILVSHDLAVVQALADRIAVLYRGRLVELGPSKRVCAGPAHPYTKALIAAVLEPDPDHDAGRIPAPRERDDRHSAGCPYAGRCSIRIERCFDEMPDWYDVAGGQMARCYMLPAAAVAL